MQSLMSADLPVYLHFGWHITCEEINRIARLPLKVRANTLIGLKAIVCNKYPWKLNRRACILHLACRKGSLFAIEGMLI